MSGDRRGDLPDDDPTIDVLLTVLEHTADAELAKVPAILADLANCVGPLREVVALHAAGMERATRLIARFRDLEHRIRAARLVESLKDDPGAAHEGPPDG